MPNSRMQSTGRMGPALRVSGTLPQSVRRTHDHPEDLEAQCSNVGIEGIHEH